ncbi:hypothetical protein [Legionella yabuuchiae]|uniref:hypothetical protein n=1 Tax=Legionella yabuuchiae TaxID=376727 RepID=UPI00105537C3|nr:hypothetical protein [Legionella yabuuchiae]
MTNAVLIAVVFRGDYHDAFKGAILQGFATCESLGDAIFSAQISTYHNTAVFEAFIKNYVSGEYDFSSYQEELGETAIDLLNSMQAKDPNERPNVEDCIEVLSQDRLMPIEQRLGQ